MLAQPELEAALTQAPTRPVVGVWARAVAHELLRGPPPGEPADAAPQPLWPGGATLVGARYTPKGAAPMIYLAETADVALREVGAVVEIGGHGALAGTRPFTLLQVRVTLQSVLDLREEDTRAQLGTTLQELTGNWRLDVDPPTHRLGAAVAANDRFDGLLAPSSKLPEHAFLVVLANRLTSARGTFCEVIDGASLQQRLPADADA